MCLHRGCTSGGVDVSCIYTEDVPLVEFMYLVFTQMMYLWWSFVPCIYTEDVPLVEFSVPCIYTEDVPLVEFMYLVFTHRIYFWWSLCTL